MNFIVYTEDDTFFYGVITKITKITKNSIFCKLHHLFQLSEGKKSIKSYIFTITYNSAITIIRKKARESEFVEYLKSVQEINVDPVDVVLEYNELTN